MSDKKTRLTPAAVAALAAGDFDNFIAAATPGGIEAQEARGQRQFVNSTTLPKRFNSGTREELEAMGVRYGEDVDDLFAEAELPAGWRKVPTDHSMWSRLVDGRGRERASIFYKAAFYDRDAFVNVSRRFGYSAYTPCNALGERTAYNHATHVATEITDGGERICLVGLRPDDHGEESEALRRRHEEEAKAWLEEHYPDWQSRTAYWDEAPAPA